MNLPHVATSGCKRTTPGPTTTTTTVVPDAEEKGSLYAVSFHAEQMHLASQNSRTEACKRDFLLPELD